MSINYEMARYTELTGEDGTKVSVSRLGGYLDGYAKGRADAIDEFEKALYEYGFFNGFSMKLEIYKEDLDRALLIIKEQNT